jgi:signal transduction histidine kinase
MNHSSTAASPTAAFSKPPSQAIPTWGRDPSRIGLVDRPTAQPIPTGVLTDLTTVSEQLQTLPQYQLEQALAAAADLVQAIGLRLYLLPSAEYPQHCYQTGGQPDEIAMDDEAKPVEVHLLWQQFLQSCRSAEAVWNVPYLQLDFQLRTLAAAFQTIDVNQLLVLPLYNDLEQPTQLLGCLSAFRTEAPWTTSEIELLQQLSREFAQTIAKQRLSHRIVSINQQMQGQTLALQQSLQQQRSLTQILIKIRASLELQTIFHSVVNELFHLLQVDRVMVYRFNPDWSGGVIAEAVGKDWQPFEDIQREQEVVRNYVSTSDTCAVASFPDTPIADHDIHLQATQGGDFAVNRSIKQVTDIYQQNFPPCYLDFLAGFNCRAYLTAPIYLGDRLWGLLACYQNETPRQWQPLEVSLVAQTAEELGVAIQQAELLAQTRSQKQELAQTLTELQTTQGQLLQAEKMSSLGQLVAGIAHEVNNPINFVHGNLNHLDNYFQEIMGVLEICRQHRSTLPANLQGYLETCDLDFITEDIPKLIRSMQMGTNRIAEIVLSLRNFSRLDEAEIKCVDIHDGIESTLLILQHQCHAAGDWLGIKILKQYADLPCVECYAGQLNQVFMNILSNAIDALKTQDQQQAPEDLVAHPSQIQIITEMGELRDRPSIVIRFKDNGPGIPETILGQIFNPFFTTKPVGKGTGLGLSISYKLITEKHQGTLQCFSNIDQGTEFRIEIPLTTIL